MHLAALTRDGFSPLPVCVVPEFRPTFLHHFTHGGLAHDADLHLISFAVRYHISNILTAIVGPTAARPSILCLATSTVQHPHQLVNFRCETRSPLTCHAHPEFPRFVFSSHVLAAESSWCQQPWCLRWPCLCWSSLL